MPSSPEPEGLPDAAAVRLRDLPVLWLLRGLALLGLVLAVLGGLHWYLGARLLRDAGVAGDGAAVGWGLVWLGLAALVVALPAGRVLPRGPARVAQWVGFGWMGAFGLLLAATAASDVVLWLLAPGERLAWQQGRALAVAGLVGPALAWGLYVARRPVVKRVEVRIPGLHPELDGFRLVQLSDVHLGETLGRAFARELTLQVNALGADAVVLTGDLVDGAVAALRDEVAPLAGLRGAHGVFFVTGNHEYYHGGSAWEAEARRLGFTVLHNEHRVVAGGRLVIGGVTDVEGARFSEAHAPRVDLAFAGAPPGVPRVLLAHQPRFARRAKDAQVALMLSGHTHGGQIFPFNLFVKLQQPVVGGFATLHGVPTYTSLGTGYWGPPFRVGPRGEISLVVLRAA